MEDWKAKAERELDAADADIKHLHTMVEALQDRRRGRHGMTCHGSVPRQKSVEQAGAPHNKVGSTLNM